MAWTLSDIREKVESDLDLQDEQFIDPDEFKSYVNAAIREAEAEIHKLNLEDQYFLSHAFLALTTGVGEYALPEDIYATKIRSIQYDREDKSYEILRFRGKKAFEDFLYWRRYGTETTDYKYMLTNVRGVGPRIAIAPKSFETSSEVVTVWYIRNALELDADTDECDIPEFINFILQFVKDACKNKEVFTPDAPPSPALEKQRQLMIDTLTEQVPDGEAGAIIPDVSHYEEST